jgi:hypothetical protein
MQQHTGKFTPADRLAEIAVRGWPLADDHQPLGWTV